MQTSHVHCQVRGLWKGDGTKTLVGMLGLMGYAFFIVTLLYFYHRITLLLTHILLPTYTLAQP
jgi:hypothetical protein